MFNSLHTSQRGSLHLPRSSAAPNFPIPQSRTKPQTPPLQASFGPAKNSLQVQSSTTQGIHPKTPRKFAISSEILSQLRSRPSQSTRDGNISTIPFATVSEPDSSRLSGISPTPRRTSGHLGSERSCWNRGSSKMFLKSSTIFVVLKWIFSFPNLLQ